MFNKILIANRGEIACRIIKTAKKLGINTVIVYSAADKNSLAMELADEAFYLGEATSKKSYLQGNKIIEIAKTSGAEAIHPGYGFLSENAEFATQCEDAGIILIAPTSAAIQAMGSKSKAKEIMSQAGIPIIAGYHGAQQDIPHLINEVEKIGFPVLLKAAAGGGGKGMRVLENSHDIKNIIASAKREAASSFGDETLLLEKYLETPRHIEVQIIADNFGNYLYLYERDCSIQRRHQKIIEEAPAPFIDDTLRKKIGETAVLAARTINYTNAGTIEFLLDKHQNFYFMEMNTRLQVEHAVTEMITGIDLVEWQIKISAGEKLPLTQTEIKCAGHAIEARIYAENPQDNFMPSMGEIIYLSYPPTSKNVRIDTGIKQGDIITPYYDPMISKLIVWDDTRDLAIKRLAKNLAHFNVVGVNTNISLLHKILTHSDFKRVVDTSYIEKNHAELLAEQPIIPVEIFIIAALYLFFQQKITAKNLTDPFSPWNINDSWRLNLSGKQNFIFKHPSQYNHETSCHHERSEGSQHQQSLNHEILSKAQDDKEVKITVTLQQLQQKFHLQLSSHKYVLEAQMIDKNNLRITIENQQTFFPKVINHKNKIIVFHQHQQYELEIDDDSAIFSAEENSASLNSPMPGTITAVLTSIGQEVKRGENLMVLEAMKMEHVIQAPTDGIIKTLHYSVGDMVSEGALLLELE